MEKGLFTLTAPRRGDRSLAFLKETKGGKRDREEGRHHHGMLVADVQAIASN